MKKIDEKGAKLPKIIEVIAKLPVLHILFMIGASLNLQLRVVHPSIVNKIVSKTFTIGSNGRGDLILRNFVDIIFGFK